MTTRTTIRPLALLLSLLLSATPLTAQTTGLIINEVMQSNIDYLLVEKDFPDSWVELYNSTDADVNLGGYRLGEHADGRGAYQFPGGSGKVPARGHLVICCDKENRGLHTSFRIDSGQASLYLFNPSGQVTDSLLLPKMPAPNIAFGRVTDGAAEWHYEVTPTAGTANGGEGSSLLLPEPRFSVPGGLQTEPFALTLSLPQTDDLPADTRLYFTVDGTEPTRASRSIVGSQTFQVSQTTVIRAKLISAHALSPVSTVQSYIFHPRQTSLPVISIVTDQEYIFGNELGIASSIVQDGRPNYMQAWRRPVNVEFYDTRQGGIQRFNQLAETAISGVSTREQPQKSFKIYANKRFGKKTFKGNFWDDKPEVGKVKSFVLRSGGNNSFTTRINDALVQKLFGTHLDNLDWQAYQPVIVYINGIYRGEAGLRERSNEDFVEANHDIEDIEMADETSYQQPADGSLFAQFRTTYRSRQSTYGQLEQQMDMDNFTKALLAEMYAMNTDFPTNNVSMWRPLEEGGRWRWILKDLDRAGMSLALYPSSFDMYNYLFNPDPLMYSGMYHFDLYKKLSTLPQWRDTFADYLLVCLGDFLKPHLVTALADEMSDEVYEELKYTFQAYNCTTEWGHYRQNLSNFKNFLAGRPAHLLRQAAAYLNLGHVLAMTVANPQSLDSDTTGVSLQNLDSSTTGVSPDGQIRINGLPLTSGDFQGSCFSARPVTLCSGRTDLFWRLTVTTSQGIPTVYTFDQSEIRILPSDYIQSPTDLLAFETWQTDTPDNPDDPEDPDTPDNPDDPDNPDNPGDPDNPDTPDTPDNPDEPEDTDALSSPASTSTSRIYSLTGVRRSAPVRGLNIILNGNRHIKVLHDHR